MATRFPLNYEICLEIDTTPNGATRTFVRVAEGITTCELSENSSVDQKSYYDDEGFATSAKLGGQFTLSISGDRCVGDAAQDYLVSTFGKYGDEAKSNVRMTASDGAQKSGSCTITTVTDGGGDASALASFACEIHFNGKPSILARSNAPALTATVAAGSVAGSTKFTATPTSPNTLAYKLSGATAGTIYARQYVPNLIAYTSAADIPAVVGQYLQMFEVDANLRVVSFSQEALEAADINPGT
jgi:hypothetical protein